MQKPISRRLFQKNHLAINYSGCLTAGTKIRMGDGSTKPIEAVVVGDVVRSYHTIEKRLVEVPVLAVEAPRREGYFEIKFSDSSSIKLTNEHPVYMRKPGHQGWGSIRPAAARRDSELGIQEITLDCEVLKLNGDDFIWVQIKTIEFIRGTIQTFNLKQVDGTHTFFAEDVLVHNKG